MIVGVWGSGSGFVVSSFGCCSVSLLSGLGPGKSACGKGAVGVEAAGDQWLAEPPVVNRPCRHV